MIVKKRIVLILALWAIPLAVIFFRYFIFHRKGWSTPEIQYQAIFWLVRMLLSPLVLFYALLYWTELNETVVLVVKLIVGFIVFSLLHWSLSFGLSRLLVQDPDHRNLNLFNTIKDDTTPLNLLVYATTIFILYAWIYFERYRESTHKALALQHELSQYQTQTKKEVSSEAPAAGIQNLVIKNASKTILVPIDTINVFHAYGPYIKIVTSDNKTHLLQRPLYQIEKQLPQIFIRVHRSSIVNRLVIKEVKSLKNGDYTLLLSNGTEIRASRTFKESIKGLTDPNRLMV